MRADIKQLLRNFDSFDGAFDYQWDLLNKINDLDLDGTLNEKLPEHEALLKEA